MMPMVMLAMMLERCSANGQNDCEQPNMNKLSKSAKTRGTDNFKGSSSDDSGADLQIGFVLPSLRLS